MVVVYKKWSLDNLHLKNGRGRAGYMYIYVYIYVYIYIYIYIYVDMMKTKVLPLSTSTLSSQLRTMAMDYQPCLVEVGCKLLVETW